MAGPYHILRAMHGRDDGAAGRYKDASRSLERGFMYTLFFSPGAAGMAPHGMLQEIGAAHRLVEIDMKAGAQRAPDFLKISPNGRVPALLDGDLAIFESAAIVMHLADKHPEAGLAPPPGTAERAAYYQWLVFLTNTVQETFMGYFYPGRYVTDEAAMAHVKATAVERLQPFFAILDGKLADGPYLLGARYSAADIYLLMLARWSRNMPKPAATYPNIKRCLDLVRARPAIERMFQVEGLV